MDKAYALTQPVEMSYDEAVDRVTELLGKEGFGILSEIDVSAKMKEKLDREMPPYIILGACAPPLAWDALHAVQDLGVFLPCNVTVYEQADGQVVVSAMDPTVILSMVEDETVEQVATEVRTRLGRVLEAL